MEAIGLAVANILCNPEETANRTVYISSFEPSMNDLLAAYKEAAGGSDWNVTYEETDHAIKEAKETVQTSDIFMEKMRAIGRLGLLVSLKRGLGGDFVAEGISDNEALDLPRGDLAKTIKGVLSSRQE